MPVIHAPSGSAERPRQYNQPSRKGKKAWRKNVDVSDVEKGLHELNEEKIKLGGPIAERPDSELFSFDVAGDEKILAQTEKRRRTLKADEIIAQRSKVPAVSLRKRPADKTTDGLVPTKRVRTNYVSQKELVRLRKAANGHHENTVVIKEASYDVWDSQPSATPDELSFIPPEVKAKAPETLRHKPTSLAANGKPIPAVRKPTGGYSYNPTYTDYEERIIEEGAKAVEAERKRLAAEEEERLKKEAAARSGAAAEAAEARAELSEWDEDSEWEGFQSGAEEDKPSVKRPQRKTKVQRNKIKRRKEEERRAKHEAEIKRKNDQAFMIKKYAREVAAREKALALAQAAESESESEGDENELRRKKLGKMKLPEKDLELVLPDELEDTLRRLKPEGNLMRDRYRNLVVQGKVESRRRIPFKKQAKVKMTEKWTHKDFIIH